ncbi:hypothetical protein SEA_HANNACONDA_181 [Mycobacterium phage Hannaconda]|nr:hypothetical protein SEA_HANNACONDA_181 [Mycobacterium phage Hannaconda]QPO16787.1 hypothetical protein SEA_KASHFLOW_186 [Mycobacterium phage KashFlow]
MSVYDEAVELLRSNIGSLPDEDFGHLNLFPFTYESDETNGIKLKVCIAIVKLLQDHGFLAADDAKPLDTSRSVRVACQSCDTALFSVVAGESGALVPASYLIQQVGRLDPNCPHKPMTLDDQRRLIQEALEEAGKR